ncbi:hypothetical protein [Oryza sativa Japonica Group]|uniref:Uncharacterized protein n=1 Tax=Oryza sativa subsp. japonica TaxID=39947 RepID=Q5ZB50_ORYSJ|nr:hypothetical protein [Oryza sativa Japonica Group]BAD53191.1 hypothetical protein [Oryza sativa Japonica Group]
MVRVEHKNGFWATMAGPSTMMPAPPLYMWVVMTVVIVFEYTVGGCVYKGFNQDTMTVNAGTEREWPRRGGGQRARRQWRG